MKRIPDDLARDLVEWAADDERVTMNCTLCGALGGWNINRGVYVDDHAPDCLHIRAKRALAELERPDRDPDEAGPGMRAVPVCPVHEYALPCPSCDMAAGVVS